MPKFDGVHLQSYEDQLDAMLNAEESPSKEERIQPLHNLQNSFESFNGSLLYRDGNDGRHQASTETVLDTSLMQSWSVQTGGTVIDRTGGGKEPAVANESMEMDGSHNDGLRISCGPTYATNAAETAGSGAESNRTPHLPSEPHSAGSFGVHAGRRSGNIIAMGR